VESDDLDSFAAIDTFTELPTPDVVFTRDLNIKPPPANTRQAFERLLVEHHFEIVRTLEVNRESALECMSRSWPSADYRDAEVERLSAENGRLRRKLDNVSAAQKNGVTWQSPERPKKSGMAWSPEPPKDGLAEPPRSAIPTFSSLPDLGAENSLKENHGWLNAEAGEDTEPGSSLIGQPDSILGPWVDPLTSIEQVSKEPQVIATFSEVLPRRSLEVTKKLSNKKNGADAPQITTSPSSNSLDAKQKNVDEAPDETIGQMLFGALSRKGEKGKAGFPDAEAMKAKVREAIDKKQYNVMDYYYTKGFAQSIARSFPFENITLLVITINSFWIAVDADHNTADVLIEAHPVFIVAENLFCLFFFFEWAMRFLSFARKCNCFRDGWFIFDSTLLFFMVGETWVLTVITWAASGGDTGGLKNASLLRIARLLRLARVARMARLFRAMPELMVLIKGIAIASRSVVLTMVLLVMIIYVFAVAFRQLTHETQVGRENFSSVPAAMATLLLKGTLPDQGTWIEDVGGHSLFFGICMVIYVVLTTILLMNMLLGILVEVVKCVSVVEKETMLVNHVRDRLKDVFKTIDEDFDGNISRSEFGLLMGNSEAAQALRDVGVDPVGLVDRADALFHHEDEISFGRFLDAVMNLRGSNGAKVNDLHDLRKVLIEMIQSETNQLQLALCMDREEMQQMTLKNRQSFVTQVDPVQQMKKGQTTNIVPSGGHTGKPNRTTVR